ncbi:hypothetical protein MUK42_14923 [Musa troglodytarum]|uniref:Uncharacterized protein n=1 Tax=Musa troglodytarum TaxID=320322 RepID=A0A9E7I6T2_9LILI|nr:hypothetical protein MUK42_14923 [Musa troglodytarum]
MIGKATLQDNAAIHVLENESITFKPQGRKLSVVDGSPTPSKPPWHISGIAVICVNNKPTKTRETLGSTLAICLIGNEIVEPAEDEVPP